MAAQLPDISAQPVNAVLDAILLHTEPEGKYKSDNPAVQKNDPYLLVLRKSSFDSILQRYGKQKGLSPKEKSTRRYLRHEVRKMDAKFNPTRLKRFLFNPAINWLVNTILGDRARYAAHDRLLSTVEKTAFQDNNLRQVKESLKETGLTHDLEGPLKKRISHDLSEFHFRHSEPGCLHADFVLHFKKLPNSDAYYFERFDAISRPTLDSVLKNEASSRRHSFSRTEKLKFSAQEASSIVNGLPIAKEKNGQEMWFALDPYELRGVVFDLGKELAKWPIKEMQNEVQALILINNLKHGIDRKVTMMYPDGTEEKFQIKANAADKRLDFYNQDGDPINSPNVQKYEKAKQIIEKSEELKKGAGIKKGVGVTI
jgi:hypothetical protein